MKQPLIYSVVKAGASYAANHVAQLSLITELPKEWAVAGVSIFLSILSGADQRGTINANAIPESTRQKARNAALK